MPCRGILIQEDSVPDLRDSDPPRDSSSAPRSRFLTGGVLRSRTLSTLWRKRTGNNIHL